MKRKIFTYLTIVSAFFSSCCGDDDSIPTADPSIVSLSIKFEKNESDSRYYLIKYKGIGNPDTLQANSNYKIVFKDDMFVVDTTTTRSAVLSLELNKLSDRTSFEIYHNGKTDTITFSYKVELKEKVLGRCNKNKFQYQVTDFKIDKSTFETSNYIYNNEIPYSYSAGHTFSAVFN